MMKVSLRFIAALALMFFMTEARPAIAGGAPAYSLRDLKTPSNPFSYGATGGTVTLTGSGSAIVSTGDVYKTGLSHDGEFFIQKISPDGSTTTLPGSTSTSIVQVIGANARGEVLVYIEAHQANPGPNGNGGDFLFINGWYFPANSLAPDSADYNVQHLASINDAGQITAEARTTSGSYTLVVLTKTVAPAATLQSLTPVDGSTYNSSQTIDFTANATDTVPFYVSWQVDSGQENRMTLNGSKWISTVSFAGWTWTGPLGGSKHDVGFVKRATSDGHILKRVDSIVTINH